MTSPLTTNPLIRRAGDACRDLLPDRRRPAVHRRHHQRRDARVRPDTPNTPTQTAAVSTHHGRADPDIAIERPVTATARGLYVFDQFTWHATTTVLAVHHGNTDMCGEGPEDALVDLQQAVRDISDHPCEPCGALLRTQRPMSDNIEVPFRVRHGDELVAAFSSIWRIRHDTYQRVLRHPRCYPTIRIDNALDDNTWRRHCATRLIAHGNDLVIRILSVGRHEGSHGITTGGTLILDAQPHTSTILPAMIALRRRRVALGSWGCKKRLLQDSSMGCSSTR